MNGFSNPKITTVLLGLIAVLLAADVIQGFQKPATPFDDHSGHNHPVASDPTAGMVNPHMVPPSASGSSPEVVDSEGNFSQGNMAFAAMACPDVQGISLGDAACTGPNVQARRDAVQAIFSTSSGIRESFDRVVAELGEDALTPQALSIRQSRTQMGGTN